MDVIAVIPARGGSKGIPGKNLRTVGGIPLVVRAVGAAAGVTSIDRVVVTTDDQWIAAAARDAGAEVVERPASLADDTASSESALLHALEHLAVQPRIVVFLQPTSPFIDREALGRAVDTVASGLADVVFSAVPSHEFLWRRGGSTVEGVNHNAARRPRRQDRADQFRETGAFYVLRAEGFRRTGHRFFGRVRLEEVDPRTAIEIDTAEELELARMIAPLIDRDQGEPVDVDAVATDFDGVHTDDRMTLDAEGREQVTVSRSDGFGVQRLRAAGVPVIILSTEANPVVGARARKLQIECRQGLEVKLPELVAWAGRIGVPLDRVAFLGNDVNDLSCMRAVGWPVAVAGSHPDVLRSARVVLGATGGNGAVRELAERVLRARGSADHYQEEPWR